jgi:dihydropteroate synthase
MVTIPCGRFRLRVADRPLVMGILNLTPDSFSDGGRCLRRRDALRYAEQMIADGAAVIDVGGESTRPGAAPVSVQEELRRVLPVVERLAPCVPVSIDTSKAEVAAAAVAAGASIVNDVTAMRGDPRMVDVVARSQAAVILMHMRGTPRTMQRNPRYDNVVREVGAFLRGAARQAERAGIAPERILIDPGIGFGKQLRHNLELLHGIDRLRRIGYPVVIGPSRKSFIGHLLGVDVDRRLAGTLACVAHAAAQGVEIVRVHDVAPAVHVVTMWGALEHPTRARAKRR